ncbi:MAG: hypothetical protein M3319_00605, partial [Actinomycetota bacterium]|nr:hypothetical protein [Actinomycetota bacterium]
VRACPRRSPFADRRTGRATVAVGPLMAVQPAPGVQADDDLALICVSWRAADGTARPDSPPAIFAGGVTRLATTGGT